MNAVALGGVAAIDCGAEEAPVGRPDLAQRQRGFGFADEVARSARGLNNAYGSYIPSEADVCLAAEAGFGDLDRPSGLIGRAFVDDARGGDLYRRR